LFFSFYSIYLFIHFYSCNTCLILVNIEGLNAYRDHNADTNCQLGNLFSRKCLVYIISFVINNETILLVPWMLITAFGLTFPVLAAKTWRLHRLLQLIDKKMNFSLATKSGTRQWRVVYCVVVFLCILYVPMILWQLNSPLRFDVV